MSKKLGSLVLAVMALVGLAACADLSNEVGAYYVAVDINPSIEFVVNEDDIVESYIFLNEDAAILCVDLDFVGMNIDDAIELYVETATLAGYIDPDGDDNAVLITVLTDDEEDADQTRREKISERIRKRINIFFAKKYINSVVLTEDFTHEDLVLEAEELGVSPGKLKLAYAAHNVDETLLLEELLELPVKDLLKLVRELHGDAFQEFKEEHWDRLREIKQERIEAHKQIVRDHIAANPEMTEEEVQEYIRNYKQDLKEETIEKWKERLQRWRQNRQERINNEE